MRRILFAVTWLGFVCASVSGQRIEEVIDIAPAWSGHPVGFELKTFGGYQYIGFYDAERRMTIGQRRLHDSEFRLVRLHEQVGWDSHNFVTFTKDDDGYLHVTGNMHGVPLIYFRSEQPNDIGSFRRIRSMVGRDESRVTYPRFFRGPAGELIFTYRQGGSGDGEQIYNVYNHTDQSWSRLLDQPLLSGEGKMNAYPRGPIAGPDGYFHLVWIWRDTPDAETSHTVSYARSRDLVQWENFRGEHLPLPITIGSGAVVDPVPPKGGAINNNVFVGFDMQDRVVVSYIKFDENGHTQIYNARAVDGEWEIRQATQWGYRWFFEGRGSLPFEVRAGPVKVEDGRPTQPYSHVREGAGLFELDEETLRPVGRRERPSERPAALNRPESTFPGMRTRWHLDTSEEHASDVRYWLRWETLDVNRDRRPEGDIPEPALLRLYKVRLGTSGD
jgi:hypothetical protein